MGYQVLCYFMNEKEDITLFCHQSTSNQKKYYMILKHLSALSLSLPHAWCSEHSWN